MAWPAVRFAAGELRAVAFDASGAAIAPLNTEHEDFAPGVLKLMKGVQTRGFKIRWPRLLSEVATTTPDVAAAFEAATQHRRPPPAFGAI